MDDENIFRFLFVIGPTPKLRELHLGGYPRQISISRDTLRNLTHFSINHDELVESDSSPFPLISQMHALQSLSLSWADIPWIHPKATTLNHLHTIHVTTWPAEFNHFTFPSLRHVHIDNINITTIKIPSFVHVLPQLTSLTLDYVPPMDVTLLRMAMMLTSLERLTILNGCIGSLFFEGLARPIVMPHLRELYMHGPSFVPVHTFVSMQLSRPGVKAILETRSAYRIPSLPDGSVMHGFGEPQQDYLFDESHGQNLLQYETLRKAIRDLHPRIRAPPRQYERLEQTVPEYGRLKDRALKL
ncbi:hypothetical protein VNI00_018563 [Paramarasmius palmivorus]|uniref:Uncharacterized protein n=1 Tax=Paramarasmius palmivorus TaxID=297713 RepID=A0AAW0AY19_9AGAR